MPERGVRAGVLLPELPLIRGGEGAVMILISGGGGGGAEEEGLCVVGIEFSAIGELGGRYISSSACECRGSGPREDE